MRVLVFGTFDNLHPGHLYFLYEAQKRGDLFVSVALDETVEKIKGKMPRQSGEKRADAIRSEFPLADVSPGDSEDYLKPVRDINPDLILLGYDQKLPPGVSEGDINCPIERLDGYRTEEFKSSYFTPSL